MAQESTFSALTGNFGVTDRDTSKLDRIDKLQELGWRLSRLAKEQVSIRINKEQQWLSDLEQYMGRYDHDTIARLTKSNGSRAFVNITRPKTTSAEARLSDVLLPTDDRNWGAQPTPVPELSKMSMNQDIAEIDEEGNEVSYADLASRTMKEARQRADAMVSEIDDQLTEAKYAAICRDIIHDACLFGTGILKGPVIMNRFRKSWNHVADGIYEIEMVSEFKPGVERVDIWNWFPDMTANRMEDCEFFFERKFLNTKQLKALAKRKGYLKDQIIKVLKERPQRHTGGTHIARLRELSGVHANLNDNRFEMWEYHGQLSKEDLEACGVHVKNELDEYNAIIVMIDGIVIKGDISPLDTGETPYSVFIYEEDDTSIFGFGVPYIMRNEQRIVNTAWRMVLDNAALCTGPQIVVNRELVIPSDGSWDLKPKKIWWLADSTNRSVNEVFATHNIDSHQNELLEIYNVAHSMVDIVTSLPLLAQGETGDAPDTATGTSMLMNSANVVLRRTVKNFDDGITKPFIGRMYDYNMQYSDKPDIKGDFEIDARGSSALLVKETQSRALTELMQVAEQPIYAELTKHVDLYRKAVQARHLNADDIVKTNEEIEAESNKPTPEQLYQQQIQQLTIEEAALKNAKIKAETDKIAQESKAMVDKIVAETANTNVKSNFALIDVGTKVVEAASMAPAIITIADEIGKSSGLVDANGLPLANLSEVAQPQIQPSDTLPQFATNTSPQNPAIPMGMNAQPQEPMQQVDDMMPMPSANEGIETIENDGLIQDV